MLSGPVDVAALPIVVWHQLVVGMLGLVRVLARVLVVLLVDGCPSGVSVV